MSRAHAVVWAHAVSRAHAVSPAVALGRALALALLLAIAAPALSQAQEPARAEEPTVDEVRFEAGRFLFAEIQGNRCVIALQGRIGPDASRQFPRVVETARLKGCDDPLLVLQSGGGAVEDGLSLGRDIHLAGYSTLVSGSCASACGLIFLGGRERILLGAQARIGFHQAGRVENPDSPRQRKICSSDRQATVYRRIWRYLDWLLGERAGPIFERSLATSCHSMDWVRGQEALSMGVATELR